MNAFSQTPKNVALAGGIAVGERSAKFTVITAANPPLLTKTMRIKDGELEKVPGGHLLSGTARIAAVASLEDFKGVLMGLATSDALTYGIPAASPVEIVTKQKWERMGSPTNPIPRSKETFDWPDGPGIMMLDYDPEPGTPALDRDAVVAVLRKVLPGLAQAELLWWASSSSYIVNGDTGQQMSGLRGQRLYLMVRNAADIPRAGQVLTQRLWLAGHGYIKVTSSGRLLQRTIFDTTVWQASRLDFAAGAECVPPLRQERGEPVLIAGAAAIVDTQQALPDLSKAEKAHFDQLVQAEKAKHYEEAQTKRSAWIEERARRIVVDDADDAELAAAREEMARCLETEALSGNFILSVKLNGTLRDISVAEVLRQRELYDGAEALDPMEPGYDGGRVVGKLFLLGVQPVLHSFARGETTYRLVDALRFVAVRAGKLATAVNETLDILRAELNVFDRAGELALVEDGRIRFLDHHALAQFLGGIVQYRVYKPLKGGCFKPVDIDPPTDLTKRILSMGKGRGFNRLEAVTNMPTLRPDGSVLTAPGYDAATGLFLHLPDTTDALDVPESPSFGDVRQAVERLMAPFQKFPFASVMDKSALLAALLTAVVRAGLSKAPAFGFDAPVQGSGKTLLASCVAMLATGADPRVFPHTGDTSDEEVRKRLFAFFRSGEGAMVWDNILGAFDSASFAAALTSSSYSDRVLGRSENEIVPTRAMILLTGNNLTLKGDMARRVLICRIDPRQERPHLRQFDVDPLGYVERNRLDLAWACLTILRGWLTSGAARSGGGVASFEAWDDWVRQAVIWLGRDVIPGVFCDPMDALASHLESNPDVELLGDLLAALAALFPDKPFSAKDVVSYAKNGVHLLAKRLQGERVAIEISPVDLADLLSQFSDKAASSARSLGKVFSNHKDKIVSGRVLRARNDAHSNQKLWCVEQVPSA